MDFGNHSKSIEEPRAPPVIEVKAQEYLDFQEALNLDDNIIKRKKSQENFLETNESKELCSSILTESSRTSRFDRVFQSIKYGDTIKTISIPGYHISDDVVFYEVVVTNTRLRWNLWVRFDSFTLLHLLLKDLAKELNDEDAELIPPIPDKHFKVLIDHLSQEFVENRRALLENFLQKINKNPTLRYAEDFIHFLLPPKEWILTPPVGSRANPYLKGAKCDDEKILDTPPKRGLEEKLDDLNESGVPNFSERENEMLNVTEQDEITGIEIRSARVLDADQNSDAHAVYHIHVRNVNKDTGYNIWTVMKRFMEFVNFDKKLRETLVVDHPADVFCLPHLPPKLIKSWTNHTKAAFIEKRRVLLQVYLRRMIRYPLFRRHPLTLAFLGVQSVSTDSERESLST